jgi:hypothetical protein
MGVDVASFLFIGALSTIFAGVIVRALRLHWRGLPTWAVVAVALLLVWLVLGGNPHAEGLSQVFSKSGR